MNRVVLMGRLTKDPTITYTQKNNSAVAKIILAVDRRIKVEGQPSADFISCTAFSKTAEFIEKYLRQGTKIALEGRIQTGNYTNKEGQKVYTTEVMIDNVEFAESKNNGVKAQAEPETTPDGFMNIPDSIDEELPFA